MLARVLLVLILSIGLSGCVASWSKQAPSPGWTTGFWLWDHTYRPAEVDHREIDVLFVHVGKIDQENSSQYVRRQGQAAGSWRVYGRLPDELPAAKEYWLVFRCEKQAVPDLQSAAMLAETVASILADGRQRHLKVVGIQLDIDSPTRSLRQYANYLRGVRKALPQGLALSITALLDWFRSGSAISDVIGEVDEFVPQFYDVDAQSFVRGAAVAAKIDPGRWGPIFNRFGKRFRVGISTFGRAQFIPRTAVSTSRRSGLTTFHDVVPLDIAANPAFRLETARNQANELVLRYRATQKFTLDYTKFDDGDTVQFILATPEGVRSAVESARQMKGNIAGVVFFRWPGSGEALTMQPDEVMIAAGSPLKNGQTHDRIDVVDGRCAAVSCVDVYLEGPAPFSSKPLRYRVHSSVEFEYFLPDKNMPVRMANPSELEVSLPPYCARGRLYLGRAVTAQRSTFEVQEQP